MSNISVKYLGLELKSPVIVSSSGLTSNVESIRKMEQNGAGAVVLKSLFEEQIINEAYCVSSENQVPEMESYINNYIKENNVQDYTNLIRAAKAVCSIPIIASISCLDGGEWVSFAKEIEAAGADALELNVFYMPQSKDQKPSEIEEQYLDTVANLVQAVSLPVSVKIPNRFTNPLNIVAELYYRGVMGVVMFNRFYEPDIDIVNMKMGASEIYSTSAEIHAPMRWIGLASAEVKTISYAASTGVHTGEDAVKMLLVGADAVQICSTVYKNGPAVIGKINGYIRDFLKHNGFDNLDPVIGKLNAGNTDHGYVYERAQFMKYFSNHRG